MRRDMFEHKEGRLTPMPCVPLTDGKRGWSTGVRHIQRGVFGTLLYYDCLGIIIGRQLLMPDPEWKP